MENSAKKTVAVLFGGVSNEHDVSVVSANNVIANIPKDKYTVAPVYITKDGEWLLYDGGAAIADVKWVVHGTPAVLSPDKKCGGILRTVGDKAKMIRIDVVFPLIHGRNGEDGTVQGLCELAGLPYVGCGVLSSAACMDKTFTKIIAKSAGVNQADFIVCKKSEIQNEDSLNEIIKKIRYKLGYPCFVKPARGGSSIGISKAENKESLKEALFTAAKEDDKILVEKAIIGRELECAVLGNENPITSVIGEITYSDTFYTYDAKYNSKDSKTLTDPVLQEGVAERIQQEALKVYSALECSGMARVDFFYDEEKDKIIFNEINTVPGFTNISMYSMLWAHAGISFPELVDRLITLAFEKKGVE
ncbi:MAG: D-alanine--D-alanine ligase [Clostridiales bacterium]|nr:D-alanine--D-alanine ligase [Clostridiales bacterium]